MSIKRLVILVIAISTVIPASTSATTISSDNTTAMLVTGFGFGISVVGSGVMAMVNAGMIKADKPNLGAGVFGVILGASTITFLTVVEKKKSTNVNPSAWLAYGLLAGSSITAGIWAIRASRTDRKTEMSRRWTIEPFLSLDRQDSEYRVILSKRF